MRPKTSPYTRSPARRPLWPGFLAAALVLFACEIFAVDVGSLDEAPVSEPAEDSSPVQDGGVPRFEEGPCAVDVSDLDVEASCGVLVVWENRAKSSGTLVELPVMILFSNAEDFAPDPLVYLSGGPGEAGIDPESWLALPFLGDRDMVLFDQRGTGDARPSLNCPEMDEAESEYDGAADCMNRLLAAGVDLSMYNSRESAADVADLVRTLGYERYNLIGISYGTRLALTVMRDHPAGLRAVVLDSVFPPHVDGYAEQPANGWSAMQRLFAACAADPACSREYPDLEAVFLETVAELDASPVELDGSPFSGVDLTNAVFQGLYNYDQVPYLPLVIYDTYDGYYDTVLDLIDYALPYGTGRQEDGPDTDSEGMFYSVECREEAPFTDDGRVRDLAAGIPEPARSALLDSVYGTLDICDFWAAGTAGAFENDPVRSDVPVLLLSGEFDPITPDTWGDAAAAHLPNAFHFVVPGVGHSVVDSSRCVQEIAAAFLVDPDAAPDTGCLSGEGPVEFYIP